jgi:hypothetical protein
MSDKMMVNVMLSRLRRQIAVCIGVAVLSACSVRAPSTGVPTLAVFPLTPTMPCLSEEILPTIEKIQPEEIRPGSVVTVSASGGYLRDNCGGYIEGSRTYKVYVDNEPVADLACYVNHCEGKFTVPKDMAAGLHCMGVQKGVCQLELVVGGD